MKAFGIAEVCRHTFLIPVLGGAEVCRHTFLIPVLGGVELLTSRLGRFTPRKEPRYRLDRRLGGSRSWCGHFEKEKFISLLSVILHT